MKKGLIYLILLTGVLSCRDSFELDSLQNPSKLVVYCFPSAQDTTYISVTNSIGVRRFTDTRNIGTVAGARVSYEVNGESRPVHQLESGVFFVTGGHQPGDRVSISVEHADYPSVTATTTVPQPVPVELKDVKEVTEYDPSWYETRDMYQLLATFTDPAETADYYAVQVRMKGYHADGNILDVRQPDIITFDEPLLQNTSEIDEDFGFENRFYDNFYTFSDQDINGQTYTLHLNISRNYSSGLQDMRNRQCQVRLYRISSEFYHFLKSINDVENNDLAQGGFAQLTPIATNIRGGVGVLGGYWQSDSQWWQIVDKESTETYDDETDE